MKETNPILVSEKLFGVLEFLANKGTCNLIDVSSALGLNKSTTHRILQSLIMLGYVKQDENLRYESTFRIVGLANQIMRRVDIHAMIRPILRELMEKTGETVHFVEREDIYAVYIDKVESYTNNLQLVSQIGNRIPLYCSGVGKAISANLPTSEVIDIWNRSDIKPLTPKTILDIEHFMNLLSTIKVRGYALDDEENELGVRCIAACIDDHLGNPRYAFSITAPISRMTDERIHEYATYVLETKDKIVAVLNS